MSYDPLAWIDAALADLDAGALRRRLGSHDGMQGARLTIAGREYVNFGSNDYLALAADPRLAEAATSAAREYGWGAGASPLVTGRSQLHELLERRLAEFEGTEAALVFNSGFAANAGAIAALVGDGDAVFSDELNHASLIDGCRLARAKVHVYRHTDGDHLQTLLQSAARFRRRLVVTDSLFSMEGDLAPLPSLCELVERHDCMLLVDEAHATGVFGDLGRGAAEFQGVESRVPIRVGTLSKALGGSGGFVAGQRRLIDWLANRARTYGYSTAPPPAQCAAALAALDIVEQEPERRQQLLQMAARLRARLTSAGLQVVPSASQIIPIGLGDERLAVTASAILRERGIWAPAIRPPTVPAGRSCLRISVTVGHTPDEFDALFNGLMALASLPMLGEDA